MQKSRIEDILTAMIAEQHYDALPQSRVEAILISICNNTEYNEMPGSQTERILLAIKDGDAVTEPATGRLCGILKSIANGTRYETNPQSRVEELFMRWGRQTVVRFILGTDDGKALGTEQDTMIAGA